MNKLNIRLKWQLVCCMLALTACGGGGGGGSGDASLPSLGTVSTPQNFVLPSAVSTVPPQ